MNAYILLLVAGFTVVAFCAQDYAATFNTYQEMRAHLTELHSQEKFSEAAELLLWAREEFPEYLFNNTFNLIVTYARMNQYENGIKALQYALDRGVWFAPYYYENEVLKPLKEQVGFSGILEQTETLIADAQEKAKPELLVVKPDKFDPEKTYPLFIALHGGSENIELFKDRWKSQKMLAEFIVAYPQSSQVIAMNGFWWHGDIELAKKEVAQAYERVVADNRVDTQQVIIGGFSSGGVAALEVVLSNAIPASGFIVLCPDWPESFSAEKVRNMKDRGVSGTIISTQLDERLPLHEKIIETFKRAGLPHQFVVIPNIGHTYPDDLEDKIDHAIDHIRAAGIIE
jgi:predicted esterase